MKRLTLAAIVLLAGCSSAPAAAPSTIHLTCETVPDKTVTKILKGSGYKASESAAVQYSDGTTWLVVLKVDSDAGVWAVDKLDSPIRVLAVDPVARVLTPDWPQASKVSPGIPGADPLVRAAKECTK